ncbi:MAG: hypothetical protein N7Q72_03585, partial [Spiroplasma sp. Tabriz.8]|nr:hypothetical protein [Spiroplasma sp. Tabriz.8]
IFSSQATVPFDLNIWLILLKRQISLLISPFMISCFLFFVFFFFFFFWIRGTLFFYLLVT